MRVLLVDDHPVVRDGLAAIIETEPGFSVVASASDAAQALAACEASAPELALVDLLLPDMDGIQLTALLRQRWPELRVLLLTSVAEVQRARAALDAGAQGYLLKDASADFLIAALRAAARGEVVLAPSLAAALRRQSNEPDPVAELSLRERDVLQLIAEGRSNADIAQALGIGETTVKTHVGNLLAKLALNDRTQVAVFAWRNGLISPQS